MEDTEVPVEDLCKKCGIGASTFPQYTPKQVIEECRSCRKMTAAVLLAGDVSEDKAQRNFNPCIVQTRTCVGLKVKSRVALITLKDFSDKYGVEVHDTLASTLW